MGQAPHTWSCLTESPFEAREGNVNCVVGDAEMRSRVAPEERDEYGVPFTRNQTGRAEVPRGYVRSDYRPGFTTNCVLVGWRDIGLHYGGRVAQSGRVMLTDENERRRVSTRQAERDRLGIPRLPSKRRFVVKAQEIGHSYEY